MTIRKILLPVADRPECLLALSHAAALALKLDANLTGCHLSPKPEQAIRADAARIRAAKEMFEREAENHGLAPAAGPGTRAGATYRWQEMHGTPNQVLPIAGRASDLVVVSRPRSRKSRVAHAFLAESVMSTGRPVLVLPQKRHARLTGHVGIAWNRSVEAARALTAAIPILQQADFVTFYVVKRDVKHGPSARNMAHYLSWHGVKSDFRLLAGHEPAERELIHALQEDNCGLLVMGGYSHSRFREHVFGGVTQFMLYDARMPVFILH